MNNKRRIKTMKAPDLIACIAIQENAFEKCEQVELNCFKSINGKKAMILNNNGFLGMTTIRVSGIELMFVYGGDVIETSSIKDFIVLT